MTDKRERLLKYFASKYVWWKTADDACRFSGRIIAQVMELGDYDDVLILIEEFPKSELIQILSTAEAGLFSPKSWSFWHYKLGLSEVGAVPPLPVRKVGVGGDTDKEVKLSFFGTIDSGRAGIPELTRDGHVLVASLIDLLASKLKVILQRIALKDYHDIAAIIQSGMRLEEGLGAAKALYGNKFQPSECLKALVYFVGGDLSELDDVTRKTLIEAVACVGRLPEMQKASKCLSID